MITAQPLTFKRAKIVDAGRTLYTTPDGRYEIHGRPMAYAAARGGSVKGGKAFDVFRKGVRVGYAFSKLADAKAAAQRDIETLERAHNDARACERARLAGEKDWADAADGLLYLALAEDSRRTGIATVVASAADMAARVATGDTSPDTQFSVCRHDRRPIGRRTHRPDARWWHLDARGGRLCADDTEATPLDPADEFDRVASIVLEDMPGADSDAVYSAVTARLRRGGVTVRPLNDDAPADPRPALTPEVVYTAVSSHFYRFPLEVGDAVAWRGEVWEVFAIERDTVSLGDFTDPDRCETASFHDLWPATAYVTPEQHQRAEAMGLSHMQGLTYRAAEDHPLAGMEAEWEDGLWRTRATDPETGEAVEQHRLATFDAVLSVATRRITAAVVPQQLAEAEAAATNGRTTITPSGMRKIAAAVAGRTRYDVTTATTVLAEIARTLDADGADLDDLIRFVRLITRLCRAVEAVADERAVTALNADERDRGDVAAARRKREAAWMLLAETLVAHHPRT